ncbi:uncharacterized protein LOC132736354 [Ruditapes philippinarum]|uniref:uncharacterized protein LOC132736354 n=1 Tax=Ruditapes philippinarum TaxID=129788 RepID=UPI00295B5406|nr:uncharacterized protein LOC132736354 [Ruditapes philippinarum]
MENERDPGRFLTSASSEPTSSVSSQDCEAGVKRIKQEKAYPEPFTDFTINLLQCGDIQSLGSAVKAGLPSVVTDCLCGILFYQDESTGEIFTADNSNVCICAPKPVCISNIFTSSQPDYTDISNLPQCVFQHLPLLSSSIINSKVGFLPVCKVGSDNVLAVLVYVCKEINETVKTRLHQVIQQAVQIDMVEIKVERYFKVRFSSSTEKQKDHSKALAAGTQLSEVILPNFSTTRKDIRISEPLISEGQVERQALNWHYYIISLIRVTSPHLQILLRVSKEKKRL